MIKGLIKLVLIMVVGILIYNYFMGTPEEKATSKKIVSEIKDVGRSIGQLLKSEKEKFDAGKYDNALDKIGDVFEDLKSKAESSGEWMDKLRELELKRENLRKKLEEGGKDERTATEQEELKKEMEELLEETEDLAEEIEKEESQ